MDDSWVTLFVRGLLLCIRRAVHKKLVGARCCVFILDESIIFPGSLCEHLFLADKSFYPELMISVISSAHAGAS